jgi:hypothetical protein
MPFSTTYHGATSLSTNTLVKRLTEFSKNLECIHGVRALNLSIVFSLSVGDKYVLYIIGIIGM